MTASSEPLSGSLTAPRRVLIVEDEPMVAEVAERYFARAGYAVRIARDGIAALKESARFEPELIILDVMLPGIDGIEVCRRVREASSTPVIMLTARGEELDKLLGLRMGADDYVTKPFSPRELVARADAVLRRSSQSSGADVIRAGDLRINAKARTVHDGLRSIDITAREFDLLAHLARHPGQVFTRDQLMATVWDHAYAGDTTTITVHMRRLRAKVERDPSRPRYLKTVWGVGYKFEP